MIGDIPLVSSREISLAYELNVPVSETYKTKLGKTSKHNVF